MVQQEEQLSQFVQQNVSGEHQEFNQAIVRELAIAIKVGQRVLQKIVELEFFSLLDNFITDIELGF